MMVQVEERLAQEAMLPHILPSLQEQRYLTQHHIISESNRSCKDIKMVSSLGMTFSEAEHTHLHRLHSAASPTTTMMSNYFAQPNRCWQYNRLLWSRCTPSVDRPCQPYRQALHEILRSITVWSKEKYHSTTLPPLVPGVTAGMLPVEIIGGAWPSDMFSHESIRMKALRNPVRWAFKVSRSREETELMAHGSWE